ncbi:MAG: sigma-70 family RNA polymerase sigma factor [Anaerolineae bacterium]
MNVRPEVEASGLARPMAWGDELRLVEALRGGDETAFAWLINQYHTSLVRLAQIYVTSAAVAEEVAQEAWLGVLQGLNNFEGRSSLKTWIFRILTNRAKTRGQREARSVPFSDLEDPELGEAEPAVEPERFNPPHHPRWPHHWAVAPASWETIPEQHFLSQETRAYLEQAIAELPPSQRQVIMLRDIEGWTSDEVCTVLGLSEANQRVLLHRARSKVRRALEKYLM